MNNFTKKVKQYLMLGGFNTHTFLSFFRGLPDYIRDYRIIRKQMKGLGGYKFKLNPYLEDKFKSGGTMVGHYFHQDIYVARKVFINNPVRHLDIGSRIDGFVAHVGVFREIEVIDIRPVESSVKNIIFRQTDLLDLSQEYINYCDSVSSLHAIEHIGLGRYGDPIDILGHEKALQMIHSILKPGGKFYFSVPIGEQRIEFNAHRVFSICYLMEIFTGKFVIDSFSYVDDIGKFHENQELLRDNIDNNFNCTFGCGIFELSKI